MLLVAIVAAVVILLVSSGSSSPAVAVLPNPVHRAGPETIFTAGAALKTDTEGTLRTLEKMGINRVRVFLTWNAIAPDPTSTTEPAGFDASNPAAYPAANWAQYDAIIKAVEAHHLGLDVVLGPPPPRWASGKGADDPATQTWWKPNAHDFQAFVHAVGQRYSGHYTPAGRVQAAAARGLLVDLERAQPRLPARPPDDRPQHRGGLAADVPPAGRRRVERPAAPPATART